MKQKEIQANIEEKGQDCEIADNSSCIENSSIIVKEKAEKLLPAKAEKSKFFTTKNITVIALLSVISFTLYAIIKFPLPFFPSFLDMQISDMPALLGGFMISPIAGCVIILIKTFLKLAIFFSSTAFVGEIGDIMIGFAYVLPASIIYQFMRTKKGAIIGIISGAVTSVLVAILVNAFVLIPFYVQFMFKGDWDMLLNMVRVLFPTITKDSFYMFYLPLSVLPFNLLRTAICGFITFFVYKGTEKVFNRMFYSKKTKAK